MRQHSLEPACDWWYCRRMIHVETSPTSKLVCMYEPVHLSRLVLCLLPIPMVRWRDVRGVLCFELQSFGEATGPTIHAVLPSHAAATPMRLRRLC
jgi:hypothetical protein